MSVLFVNAKSDKYEATVKLINLDSLNGNSENKKTTQAELLANGEPIEGYFSKEPVILPRLDFPYKFYIYTRGPYRSTDPFRDKELLAFWYYRCLELADEKHCSTLQIPLITNDTYSYETAMQIAYDSCQLFFKYELPYMSVFIVVPGHYEDNDTGENQERWVKSHINWKRREFAKISSYIKENYRYDKNNEKQSESALSEAEYFSVSKVIKDDYYRQKKLFTDRITGNTVTADDKSSLEKSQNGSQSLCLYQESFEPPQKKKSKEDNQVFVLFQTGPGKPDIPDKDDFKVEETFREMLLRLMNEKDMTAPEIYTKACMDRKLFSKIQSSDEYQPRKYTVVRLALALGLSLDETDEFMNNAGFALSHGKIKDLVIEYCIKNDMKSVSAVNEILEEWGLTTI